MSAKARTLLVLAAAAWACGSALGDDIVVSGLTYSNAKITGLAEGQLTWDQSTGNSVSKPLDAIQKLSITGQDTFNQAEEELSKGKAADAVKDYDQALDMASGTDWLKQLVLVRRLKALDKAGMIDRGAKEWLDLLDQTGGAKFAMSLRPSKLGAKGSEKNDKAIALLKDKLTGTKGETASAIKKLLMELYDAQGQSAEAAALAGQISGTGKSGKVGTGDVPSPEEPRESPSGGGSISDQLSAADVQIKSGQAQQALSALQANLKHYSPGELPKALLRIGKAQMALAKNAADARKEQLQTEAGLNFMRVVVFYPTTREAPEAIYLAGMVNLELGNRPGARAAFNKVLGDYKDTEYAGQAKAAIEEMEKTPAAAPATKEKTPAKKAGAGKKTE